MKVLRLLKTPNWEFPDSQVVRTLFSLLRVQVQFLVKKLTFLQGSCHSPPTLKNNKTKPKKNTDQSRQISMFYYLIEIFRTGDHMVNVSLLEALHFSVVRHSYGTFFITTVPQHNDNISTFMISFQFIKYSLLNLMH